MDAIDEAMVAAEREWRACGIRRRDRAVLAADLRLELRSAAADGVTPEQLLGSDLRGFARQLADEAGVQRVRHEYARLTQTALTGAVLGACVGAIALVLVYPILVAWIDVPRGFRMPTVLAVLLYYGTAAALAVGGAVIAVRARLGHLPRIRQTANAMIVLLPIGGAIAMPVTMGFARAVGYSTHPLIMAIEAALVAAAVTGATLVARKWSLRDGGGYERAVAA
ncbi:hypothetical protein F6X68_12200 [Micromonospora sp. AMSO12t]|uniref:hypothetical protein n=1 Tax=unclassified Micromonospora TaxID=2617518 RepID=UPI00124AE7BF|nr:hypothetical protein [Micromonospora sp. AMSO12t]KAB1155661.1 hypothetical protein F6X68_12200 [Micromonospora sp. AMSO12t]